jgi:hypothetical protein
VTELHSPEDDGELFSSSRTGRTGAISCAYKRVSHRCNRAHDERAGGGPTKSFVVYQSIASGDGWPLFSVEDDVPMVSSRNHPCAQH